MTAEFCGVVTGCDHRHHWSDNRLRENADRGHRYQGGHDTTVAGSTRWHIPVVWVLLHPVRSPIRIRRATFRARSSTHMNVPN